MRLFSFIAAITVLLGPVQASTVTYGLKFLDGAGVAIGAGSFSFDPAVTMEVYLASETSGALCDPVADPQNCFYQATWTPVTLAGEILGISITQGFDGLVFLEGSYIAPGRCQCGRLDPTLWTLFDELNGEGIAISVGDFSFSHSFLFASLGLLPLIGDTGIGGTVRFEPLQDVPLPGAARLFLVGLGTVAMRRRLT